MLLVVVVVASVADWQNSQKTKTKIENQKYRQILPIFFLFAGSQYLHRLQCFCLFDQINNCFFWFFINQKKKIPAIYEKNR